MTTAARHPHSILVAEDDRFGAALLAQQLSVLGFPCRAAVTGLEALEHWRGGGFSLLLTDLNMPDMNGYELATAIRQEEVAPNRIPIIALSSDDMTGKAALWIKAGIDAYLMKPARLANLMKMLEAWLLRPPGESAGQ
jgi:CheY-like chemotaxis protein